MRNALISTKNKSGIVGVSWHKRDEVWATHITIFGKRINLGSFTSKLDAAKMRLEAEIKHGFPDCNTISTACLYIQGELT